MLVFQHAQILVDIHDPRHWPGTVWRRQKHQQAAALKGTDRNRARQSLPGAHWEVSESRRELVSARSGDMQGVHMSLDEAEVSKQR